MEVISQGEIESLVAQSAQQAATHQRSPVRRSVGEEAQPYDFAGSGRFSKAQLRTLQIVHSSFARTLASVMTAYFGVQVQTELTSVEQMTFDEYVKFVSMPPMACLFRMDTLASSAVLEMEPQLVFAIIDRLAGGHGEAPQEIIGNRYLTEIEQATIQRIISRMLEVYAESWSGTASIKPEIQGMATFETFTQIALPGDVSLTCFFEFIIGPTKGLMTICFPAAVLESMLAKVGAGAKKAFGTRGQTEIVLNRLRKSVEDVEIDMEVVLGQAVATISELLHLDVGDVIRLDTDATQELEIHVQGIPKFRGRPGTVGRKMAVQITEVRHSLRQPAEEPAFQQVSAAAA